MPSTVRLAGALTNKVEATCWVMTVNCTSGCAAYAEYTIGMVIATSPRSEKRTISTLLKGAVALDTGLVVWLIMVCYFISTVLVLEQAQLLAFANL